MALLQFFKNLFAREHQPDQSIETGTIKFINARKGYGFISRQQKGKDIFVHISHLEDRVTRGDLVTFEITRGKKGYEARNVRRV